MNDIDPLGSAWGVPDFLTAIIRAEMDKVRAADIEAAVRVAEAHTMTGPAPIGPLFGVGWNAAVESITAALRKLAPASPASGATS